MKHIAKILAVASILLAAQSTLAQSPATADAAVDSTSVNALTARYPSGAIQSSETADRALTDVKEARDHIETRFAADQKACYPKFFTTSCLNKATERKRLDLLLVKPIEVEANAYIRHARVVERDRKLAEKAAQRASDAALNKAPDEERTDNIKPVTNEQAEKNDAQRKANTEAYAKKTAEHEKKQQSLKEKERADAQERAANVAKYQAKVQDSKERQKEVAEKKAEKERELSNK